MALGNAPGPDGFTSNFFHFFWELIKGEVLTTVEESRRNCGVLKAFNATFLSLILKEEGADSPSKFRLIALCNVIYKIITKVIANMPKPLLPILISPEQSGFVEHIEILDGIILVHETLQSLKITKKPGMLIKLDIKKAYDKLSLQYMRGILEAFGFDSKWINWIRNLVSTHFFSILLNGSPTRLLQASRGIRQGDPLSPFLFILMEEGLSRILQSQASGGGIRGLKLYEGMGKQTHQQFVDDTMLMGHPLVQESQVFKNYLNQFAKASGL